MEEIASQVVFSKPTLISSSTRSQVIRCSYRLGKANSSAKLLDCVLKFFPCAFRLSYEKELVAYNRLLELSESSEAAFFPTPLGYAEWSPSKYAKVIGRNLPSLLTGTMDKVIYVLMLEFVEGLQLDSVEPSEKFALSVMSSLCRIHNLGVVHGDISKSNVLISDEGQNALQFFSDWVSVNRSF
jgi:serine/threonine protein kinase